MSFADLYGFKLFIHSNEINEIKPSAVSPTGRINEIKSPVRLMR